MINGNLSIVSNLGRSTIDLAFQNQEIGKKLSLDQILISQKISRKLIDECEEQIKRMVDTPWILIIGNKKYTFTKFDQETYFFKKSTTYDQLRNIWNTTNFQF
jgi:hypothetical protein